MELQAFFERLVAGGARVVRSELEGSGGGAVLTATVVVEEDLLKQVYAGLAMGVAAETGAFIDFERGPGKVTHFSVKARGAGSEPLQKTHEYLKGLVK